MLEKGIPAAPKLGNHAIRMPKVSVQKNQPIAPEIAPVGTG
jgi:hypothetical protein